MDIIWLGYIAGTLTSISMLPQAIKSYRIKETKDLSLPMIAILFMGLFLWLVYGLIITDGPLIFTNTISSTLAGSVLLMKLRYG
jgi:MtN3 and saliva related transmembrane protein